MFSEQWSHAPLFTTVASFHHAESRQELLLIFLRFKHCSTWDPVNSTSRSCVTKQLVASNHRKRGRHHVAKRFHSRVCVKWICNLWKIRTKNNVMLLKFLKSNNKRHYSFNINQHHAIFYRCSANKKVELKEKHKQMINE
jgi:hypothetical protein